MRGRLMRYIVLAGAAILIVAAGFAWFSYVAYGIAYGSIKGLAGRERDLAEFGERAATALGTAALCEAVAVGAASWVLIPTRVPKWARFCASAAIAGTA